MAPEVFENLLVQEIERLGIPVRPYPQNPKDYFPEHDPGEVLIRYEGRKPVESDMSGQHCRMKFFVEIIVATRQVRGAGGAYNCLNRIFEHLEGRTLEGMSGQLVFEVESFVDEINGLWQFGQKWSAETQIYQQYSDDYERNLAIE